MKKNKKISDKDFLIRVEELLTKARGAQFPEMADYYLRERIHSRMTDSRAATEETYLEYLNHQPGEIDRLIHELTINVSRFFRDSGSFELISQYFIPEIMDQRAESTNKEIRIWSAGCAAGEEAFSIAILFHYWMKQLELALQIRIFATDISEEMLKKATRACYDASSLVETSHGFVERYFDQEDGIFRLNSEITELVRFFRHDMLDMKSYVPRESIFGNFDMVLCRNVMIYMNEENRAVVFRKLWKSLRPGGILVLGQFEMPPGEFQERFTQESRYFKIYRKKPTRTKHPDKNPTPP